jgi:hypothetical protein
VCNVWVERKRPAAVAVTGLEVEIEVPGRTRVEVFR